MTLATPTQRTLTAQVCYSDRDKEMKGFQVWLERHIERHFQHALSTFPFEEYGIDRRAPVVCQGDETEYEGHGITRVRRKWLVG